MKFPNINEPVKLFMERESPDEVVFFLVNQKTQYDAFKSNGVL